jgi:hypothetical protein
MSWFSVEVDGIFPHMNAVITGMRDYLYVIAGISIGFTVVRRIIAAMRRGP